MNVSMVTRCLIFSILFLSPSLIYADSLSLTTYYPAPYGSYSQFRLVPQADLADSVCANSGTPLVGTMYVNNSGEVKICGSAGTWTNNFGLWEQVGSNIYIKNAELPANDNWKIGFGTVTPNFKFTLTQNGGANADSGIMALGLVGTGATLSSSGAGTKFLWYPRKGVLRAGGVSGNKWDDGSIGNYTVAFGFDNQASAINSSILGGSGNTIPASGLYNVIAGGLTNTAAGSNSAIGGGNNNNINAGPSNAVIAGGTGNAVNAGGDEASIVGGSNNQVGARYATVGGGRQNNAGAQNSGIFGGDNNLIANTGTYSFIGGGGFNRAPGSYAVVAGGGGAVAASGNQANGNYSFVGGGTVNIIAGTGVSSTIGGGANNRAPGSYATVAGGGGAAAANGNFANGTTSTVGGGSGNRAGVAAADNGPTVSGGVNNHADGAYTVVSGGLYNQAIGILSTVGGGGDATAANITNAPYSTISGGVNNQTAAGAQYSTIPGGWGNRTTGLYSFAAGRNVSANADGTFIFGNAATSGAAASAVTTANTFVVYPTNEGNMVIGNNANAGGGNNGPYKLYVNGLIGGNLDAAAGHVGRLWLRWVDRTDPGAAAATEGFYAVYAP